MRILTRFHHSHFRHENDHDEACMVNGDEENQYRGQDLVEDRIRIRIRKRIEDQDKNKDQEKMEDWDKNSESE